MKSLIRTAVAVIAVSAVLLAALAYSKEVLFAISGFLFLAGAGYELLNGKDMERRGLFQIALVILYLVMLMATPRCSSFSPPVQDTGVSEPY